MKSSTKTAVALVAGAVMLVMASSATTAVATRLITGNDIANGSITGADIAKGSVKGNRIAKGSVQLHHLNRDSIRAGHAHASKDPIIIASGGGIPTRPRDSSRSVNLTNGVNTAVATVSNLAPGTYLLIATGEIGLAPGSYNSKWYPNQGYCSLGSASTTAVTQIYAAPAPYDQWYNTTIAMSRVVTLSGSGSLSASCKLSISTPSPPTGYVGLANVDLTAIPLTTYSAG